MNRLSKILYVALVLYLLFIGFLIRDRYLLLNGDVVKEEVTIRPKKPQPKIPATVPPQALPSSFQLEVPFTTQAPFGIWDDLHGEACEEASLLMVYYYRTGQKFTSKPEADTEIKKLVAWEERSGYKVDLTADELVAVAAGYLKLKTGRVITNPTVEQIKTEIAAGRPVVVPAAGRELKNPNFTPPGPIYHMLVIKGYDKDGFITNDPGTRNGESYRYTFDRMMTAMHDWDPANILNGQKAVIVFD